MRIRSLLLLPAVVVFAAPFHVAAQPKAAPAGPVKATDPAPELKPVGKPKELSAAVKKGLEYLVKNQREDGGWNEGGLGLADSDVADTSIALLALVRAGSTPTAGEHRDAVAKGLKFLLAKIDAADKKDLPIAPNKLSLLQNKIGAASDTFLATILLAELRGKAGHEEKDLTAALEKLVTKIVNNQKADGFFPETGLTPVLAIGLGNTALARARLAGVGFDDRALDRAFLLSEAAANGTVTITIVGVTPALPTNIAGVGKIPGLDKLPKIDFGMTLYNVAQGARNTQAVVSVLRVEAVTARAVLKGGKGNRAKAQQTLNALKQPEAANEKIQIALAKQVRDEQFIAGFGSNGGEEYLSHWNISESLLVRGGKDWEFWDAHMLKDLEKNQDRDGGWSGHHCITGKTFCTSAALLVLTTDRTPFPAGAHGK